MKKTLKTALIIALALLIPAAMFAGGSSDSSSDSAVAAPTDRTTFDHKPDDIRYYNTPADYQAKTGMSITSYNEAPMLAERVKAGELPPVDQRVSDEPLVVVPYQEIGQYGGYANVGSDSTGHYADAHMLLGIEQFDRIAGDLSTQSPNIATSWELSADAKTLTVNLRKGMKWNDGEPFTTADIKFWYEDILGNDVLTPSKPAYWSPGGELMQMKFLNDYTFQYIFAAPQPSFPELLAHPNRGVTPLKHAKHYFSQFHEDYVDVAKLTAMAKEEGMEAWDQLFGNKNRSWSDLPLGNIDRPCLTIYDLVEYGTDLFIWERNPYYWKVDVEGNQLPYMDGVRVELIQDIQVFAGKIIAGEMTISTGWYTPLSDYTLLKENEASGGYHVELWPSLEGCATIFQLNRTYDDPVKGPLFADKRFSQALSLGLDRDEMNAVLFQGLGTPRQMTLIKESIYFKPEFAEAYADFDLGKANGILDSLGLKWDSNHEWRLYPNGDRLSILLSTSSVGSVAVPIVELAAAQWKEIGVELIAKGFSYEQNQQRSMSNQMEMFICAGFNARSEAFAASPLFFVPQRQGWENPWGNQWALWYVTGGESGIEPPDEVKMNIDRWERMVTTMDMDEKIRMGQEILASQAENLWTIGTVGEVPLPVPVSNKLRNFPERGGHDWSIGSWTTPQHPGQFYLVQE